MNAALLKYKMSVNEVTFEELRNYLKISKSALYRKLKGVTEFTRNEIMLIIKKLKLSKTEVMTIFFEEFVSYTTH